MSVTKKVIISFIIVFVIQLVGSFLSYIFRIVLSNNLSIEEYGLYFSAFTTCWILTTFSDIGLNAALAKYIPIHRIEKKYSEIKSLIIYSFLFDLIVTSILVIIIILSRKYLSTYYFQNPLAEKLLIILLFGQILNIFQKMFTATFLGLKEMFWYASVNLIKNIILIFGSLFLIKNNFGVYGPAITLSLIVPITIILYTFIFIKKYHYICKQKIRYDLKQIKKYHKYGFPVLFSSVSSVLISNMDTLSLTFLRNLKEVGLYNVAMPISTTIHIFSQSLSAIMLPIASELYATKNKELTQIIYNSIKYLLILSLPLSVIFIVYPKEIITLLFNKEFVSAYTALQILAVGTIFLNLQVLNTSILNVINEEKEMFKLLMKGVIMNLILNFLTIPYFGINGAAISTSISYFYIFIKSYFLLKKKIDLKFPVIEMSKIIFILTLYIVVLSYIKHYIGYFNIIQLIIVLILSSIYYLFFILVLKVISFDEIKQIKNMIFSRK